MCTLYIHMKLSIAARLHMLRTHMAAWKSSCTVSLLYSSILHLTLPPLSLLEVMNATLPPTPSWTHCREWFPLLRPHNAGWILWPTTPRWHISKSLTVTSDDGSRGNRHQSDGSHIICLMSGSRVDCLTAKWPAGCFSETLEKQQRCIQVLIWITYPISSLTTFC